MYFAREGASWLQAAMADPGGRSKLIIETSSRSGTRSPYPGKSAAPSVLSRMAARLPSKILGHEMLVTALSRLNGGPTAQRVTSRLMGSPCDVKVSQGDARRLKACGHVAMREVIFSGGWRILARQRQRVFVISPSPTTPADHTVRRRSCRAHRQRIKLARRLL